MKKAKEGDEDYVMKTVEEYEQEILDALTAKIEEVFIHSALLGYNELVRKEKPKDNAGRVAIDIRQRNKFKELCERVNKKLINRLSIEEYDRLMSEREWRTNPAYIKYVINGEEVPPEP